MECTLCPRACGATRTDRHHLGFCRSTNTAMVTRAAPHMWEEPCISGTKGSGTIFFAGCNLQCIYCQNEAISRNGFAGKPVDVNGLRKLFQHLKEQGVHNINLVTPTHFLPIIRQALLQSPGLPVVYNCGGYESVPALKTLQGLVDIYLPDMKYDDSQLSLAYSGAADYPTKAKEAIIEMVRQVGPCQFDQNGLLQKGVIIRHMILPGHTHNTIGVIRWVADTFEKDQVLFSLMCQYTPTPEVATHKQLHRAITRREYEKCRDALFDAGIENGYVQELTAIGSNYIPEFDGTGL